MAKTPRAPSTLKVSSLSRLVLPPAPTGVSAVQASATSATITWGRVQTATSYTVYRAGGVVASGLTARTFTDTGLTNGSYSYTVQSVNGNGAGPVSSAANVTIGDVTAPTAPGISATAASSTAITVALVTPATDATGIARYELEWSATGTSGWTVLTTSATFPYSHTGLSANTVYYYRARAIDSAPAANAGPYSTAASAQTAAAGWAAFTGPTFTQGTASNWSFAAFAPVGATNFRVASGTLPSGVTLDSANKRLAYDGVGAATTASGIVLEDVQTAVADWQSRISGPGVVWYHGFESDNEVNNFRWTPGFSSGNDPQAVGTARAPLVRRITTDGSVKSSGGTTSCLEILRLAGSADGSNWWRPMSPIQGGTTTGNGRGAGQNDPGAAGTITPKAFAPTSGGSQTASWNGGVYANPAEQTGSSVDGTEYYMQARVKIDARRTQGAANLGVTEGKLFYLTRTDRSNTDQEIVIESYHPGGGGNAMSAYRGGGYVHLYQDAGASNPQVGSESGSLWTWPPGEWATILFHVRPGTMSGGLGSLTGNGDTLFEVWVARQNETSYTKIWSQNIDLSFDVLWGHNAVICDTYHNGETMTEFYHRYDQLIFSKQFIPCPQAW